MRVQHLTNKGSGKINEDTYLISSNLYGVFDGATGLIKYSDKKGNTGGLLAAQIAKKTFEKNIEKPLLISAKKIIAEIRKKMQKAKINLNDKGQLWATAASTVRIKNNSIEYLRIGDCPILLIDKNNKIKSFFFEHDAENKMLRKKLILEGVKNVNKDHRVIDQDLKNRRNTNIVYGTLNGEKEALKFVETGAFPRNNLKYILIFSDGMIIPKSDPEAPEDFRKIVDLFIEGGLENVKEYVRKTEDSDPDCTKYPRFKQHDDLTAIAITL